jgi:hypothetical protein
MREARPGIQSDPGVRLWIPGSLAALAPRNDGVDANENGGPKAAVLHSIGFPLSAR